MMKEMISNTFETKNGVTARVRPLHSQDTPFLVDLFEHMGSDSRYSRFHQPLDNVALERVWQEAEAIAHMPQQVGFIAFFDLPEQPNAPIGVARYVCTGDGVVEAAVSVRDDMQGQGVGTRLMFLLVEEARVQGVHNLTATIQSSNKAIIRVLNRLPYPLTRKSSGPDSELELHLSPPNRP